MSRPRSVIWAAGAFVIVLALIAGCAAPSGQTTGGGSASVSSTSTNVNMGGQPAQNAGTDAINEGRRVFREETFGDAAFWSDTLQLNQAILGSKAGGVGAGLSPKQALAAGLKVDADALPADLKTQLQQGKVNLDDPAVTAKLIQLGAVVGVRIETSTAEATASAGATTSAGAATSSAGATGTPSSLPRVGITCAFCHSTVDDSFTTGIGRRQDGWPNRDLNVGAIISMAPNLKAIADVLGTDEATVKKVLAAWGPGRFDAELILDGKGFRPDGKTAATLIPPAYGLAGVNLHTFEGWGSVTYWNAFVANLEMNGMGTFYDPRLDDATKFPVAAKNKLGHTAKKPDLISPHLPALHVYQLSIPAPSAPATSFEATMAASGKAIFDGKGKCATCHVPPTFVEPGWSMHKGSEIGVDNFQADRSPDGMYRTTPLKGAWAHAKGGYYHDGRFADLAAVVEHYDKTFNLGLSSSEKQQLVEYLKSL